MKLLGIQALFRSGCVPFVLMSMVSEVSVHSHLVPLLLGLCMLRQSTMAGSVWWSRVAHLLGDRR
jgi:hypothetical protein